MSSERQSKEEAAGRPVCKPKRTPEGWDAFAQEWSDELQTNENRRLRSERRVAATVDYLVGRGALHERATVVDIGCGFGKFVAAYALHAAHVLGTDISSKMLELGAKHVREQGIENASFELCDFKGSSLDELGWRNAFDLVCASITPAVTTVDDLNKMTDMSRGCCYLSTFVQSVDPLEERIVAEVLGGTRAPRRDGQGFFAMVDELWRQGYFPEVSYFDEHVDDLKVPTLTMAARIAERHLEHPSSSDAEAVLAFLNEQAVDGRVRFVSDWRYGWLFWDVRERDCRRAL